MGEKERYPRGMASPSRGAEKDREGVNLGHGGNGQMNSTGMRKVGSQTDIADLALKQTTHVVHVVPSLDPTHHKTVRIIDNHGTLRDTMMVESSHTSLQTHLGLEEVPEDTIIAETPDNSSRQIDGFQYTWSELNIEKKLDRIIANEQWLDHFGSAIVSHLLCHQSDHTPLMLNCR
ncbi:DNAse I-like superfamily protein [Striga asiatica]|uniref:DNAse I-like superfamily protein n=1 Tax=Striga asiatica TaxID=4170 RepID=A0A5A7Q626_STRAF|nr:DNAse I-like superfamily protein [Striga asiatica]